MQSIIIDEKSYEVYVQRAARQDVEAICLLVVSFLPNHSASQLLAACIRSIRQFTTIPYDLWIVDNASPEAEINWLRQLPDINLVLNRTRPTPLHKMNLAAKAANWLRRRGRPTIWGSYANGVALEIGQLFIEPYVEKLMTLHMDTMACQPGWLSFLAGKLSEKVAGAGVRLDRSRQSSGILHILGAMFDLQMVREKDLSFMPALPQFDVGDRISYGLKAEGYQLYACRNSLWEPSLVQRLPESSPMRRLHVDRAFNEQDEVIHLHLGRGVQKSKETTNRHKTTIDDWLQFADNVLNLPALQ